jgi:hypothetical protein
VNRDLNAALSLKLEGLSQMVVALGQTETENAWGTHVRLPLGSTDVDQEFHGFGRAKCQLA